MVVVGSVDAVYILVRLIVIAVVMADIHTINVLICLVMIAIIDVNPARIVV